FHVTGVQTCALPIYAGRVAESLVVGADGADEQPGRAAVLERPRHDRDAIAGLPELRRDADAPQTRRRVELKAPFGHAAVLVFDRSEERRGGKERRAR